MDEIAIREQTIYKDLWNGKYKKSQCATPLIEFINRSVSEDSTLMEIGCGDCTTSNGLIELGYDVVATDLVGLQDNVIECTAWDLPFENNTFDCVYSTDVFEHFPPEKVDEAILEAMRVSKTFMIHIIATWEDIRGKEILHKSVHNIDWWKNKFEALNTKGLELIIIDRDKFL